MNIEFKQLSEISPSEIIELMNDPRVRKHMPLAKAPFDEAACRAFLLAKQKMWVDFGYGPWAFLLDGKLIGWGGMQPEQGDADLALVLHPHYWGLGKTIYEQIIEQAFGTFGFSSVTVLFPPTRNRIKGLLGLGFTLDGELMIEGERFLRYRLAQNEAEHGPTTNGKS